MDMIFYGFAVMLFGACILMVEGAVLWWSGTRGRGAKRIARRLRLMSGRAEGGAEKVSILKQRRYSRSAGLERLLRRLPQLGALDRLLLQSGLKWSVAQFLAGGALLLLGALALPRWWDMPAAAAFGFAAMALALPHLLLLRARAGRLRQIEGQLPEAADFLARALRAGHSFSNVMQMVGAELPEPISGEFRQAYEEIHYGVPMSEALQNLAARIPLTDLRYLVIAVLIQRESGGNLAEVLGSISRIIRARLSLLAQVRVMSAEGRMSAWVLGLLPVGVVGAMLVTNYSYISKLWLDPMGVDLLWAAGGMIVVGVLWMRQVIQIRV